MTPFEQALADYRAALEAAWGSAATAHDAKLYTVHKNGLKLIERRYAQDA